MGGLDEPKEEGEKSKRRSETVQVRQKKELGFGRERSDVTDQGFFTSSIVSSDVGM